METVRIGVIGDFDSSSVHHAATNESLRHAADSLRKAVAIDWLPTSDLYEMPTDRLRRFDAFWCSPGSPYESMTGALKAISFARENRIPLLGTCGGFQHMILEFARNVLGFIDAQHAEYDSYASKLFITKLTCSLVGKAMNVTLTPQSLVGRAYETTDVRENYYCNFGLNQEYASLLEAAGLRIVGTDQDGEARIIELPDHPFFVGTLFVPQLRSTAASPHPLIAAFVMAAHGKPS